MRMRVSARLQATAAPDAPAPTISTSTGSFTRFAFQQLGAFQYAPKSGWTAVLYTRVLDQDSRDPLCPRATPKGDQLVDTADQRATY